MFGKTVANHGDAPRGQDDKTQLVASFTVQDADDDFLTADVRVTSAEELAATGAANLSLSDVNRNWSEEEDKRLLLAIDKFGHHESNWEMVSAAIGGHRSSLSCKSRWARVRAANSAQEDSGANKAWSEEEDHALSDRCPWPTCRLLLPLP